MAFRPKPPVIFASGAAVALEPPLSARRESVRASAGLAAGCSANCAGGCAVQRLIIVRLHFDSTDDKRKGGIIVEIEIYIYASGSLMF